MNDQTSTKNRAEERVELERLVMTASISGVGAYVVSRGGGAYHIQRSQEVRATDPPMTDHEHMICDLCRRVLQLEAELSRKPA